MNLTNVFPTMALLMVVFITGCKKDEDSGTSPKVTSTNPINNATNASINGKLSATFSVPMDSATITSATYTLMQGTSIVAGTALYSSTAASFSPAVKLLPNMSYTATFGKQVVRLPLAISPHSKETYWP